MAKRIFIGWFLLNCGILWLGGDLVWLNAGLTVIGLAILSVWLACKFLVWLGCAFSSGWDALWTPRPSLRRSTGRAYRDYQLREYLLQNYGLDPTEYQQGSKRNKQRFIRDLDDLMGLGDE